MCHVVLEYLFNELKQSAMRKSRSRKKVPSFIVFLFYCGSLLSLLINDIANTIILPLFSLGSSYFFCHFRCIVQGTIQVLMLYVISLLQPGSNLDKYIWSNHDHQRKQLWWWHVYAGSSYSLSCSQFSEN